MIDLIELFHTAPPYIELSIPRVRVLRKGLKVQFIGKSCIQCNNIFLRFSACYPELYVTNDEEKLKKTRKLNTFVQ